MTLQEQAANQAVIGAEEEALRELSLKIVLAAIADGASDIHVNPASKETQVRFRIDGVMHDVLTLPKNVHGPLTARFKALGDLDIENRRMIQDGRFDLEQEGRTIVVRENVLPSTWGEKLTMRILPQQHETPTLERLGYREADRRRLEEALRRPAGLLVFSGPVGSGKTTTMYAALQQIIKPEIVTMTIEDPVEVNLPGVVQVPVNKKAGMTFASVLRGMMRSDPDVIMVGNIPDLETAEMAMQAAITGHLILSQLHATDAPGTIQRLLDMSIEPFIISQSLVMASAQRLVRKVCPDCKKKAEYPAKVLAEIFSRAQAGGFDWPEQRPVFFSGGGCDNCRGTGYRGRTIICETMLLDPELSNMIAERIDPGEIGRAAVRKGMTTMLADGIYKAMTGQTTLEEVMRVGGG
jgi:type IV pilus assembly protein PilB